MWMRSKKSQSAGKVLILLWAAEPEIESAVRTLGGRSSKPTILRHLAEAGEVRRGEVEHRDAVAVDAGVDVDDEVAAARLGLHGRDPVLGLLLVELDAQALRPTRRPGRSRRLARPRSTGACFPVPAGRLTVPGSMATPPSGATGRFPIRLYGGEVA